MAYLDTEKLLEILRDAASARPRSTIHWIVAVALKGRRMASQIL
jgi:hypothetical protein